MKSVADLCDEYADKIEVLVPIGFKHYGAIKQFWGQIQTVKCHEDNSLVKRMLEQDGSGKVLVVDGGGSMRCALMGDNVAALAIKNSWSGAIIYGCIRDSAIIAGMELGLMALGTHPRKSIKRNEGQLNTTVCFAGAKIIPGQYIYVDEDGIITSPENIV